MANSNISSTPISATTKRGRNDTSGVSESNGQERSQYYQTTRIFNAPVSLQIEWDDFVHKLKGKYPGIADIIRLKNKAQQPVRAVKLEFLSAKNERHGYFSSSINILCFNVRGLDLRWGEVCLLVKQHLSDVIVLGEVGRVDFALISAALSNHNVFYQSGENTHGGMLVMVRKDISIIRVSCSLPNICALDLQFNQTIRLLAMYAPESKTWNWTDVTPLVTNCCMIFI
ncbi:unnamed protein product [Rotaria magnacalcarata]|uniref:Endonuclease/exonuclease/phosphatase domain-containing protein n=1 Tax=Rotaria magnacalcarata TaxID=392030 RepID=A0A820DFN7_9BILA|nr:unnamed protein product [Rotaria magnacalcarata]